MIIFITETPQRFKIDESTECTFDGRFLQTNVCENMILSQPAHLGEAYFVSIQKDGTPCVERAKIPTQKGAKLAWALSFIGDDKCARSESDFYDRFNSLVGSGSITNIAVFSKHGQYGFALANLHIPDEIAPNGRPKVITNTPVLAWISDTISGEFLTELLDKYASRKPLPCNKELFYLL